MYDSSKKQKATLCDALIYSARGSTDVNKKPVVDIYVFMFHYARASKVY